MKEQTSPRHWVIFVSVAVLFHLLIFVFVRPYYFSVLLSTSRTAGQPFPGAASPPDAILYIAVELEEPARQPTVTQLVDETPPEATVGPAEGPRPTETGDGSRGPQGRLEGPYGLADIFGNAARPLPQAPEEELVRIPPRPLQITWPDTRRLKLCLGHQIDIRVQVDENGRILRVESPTSAPPAECVRAALECASQIVFAPGKINGRAARMWTEIRIDFRERD